MKLLAQIIAIFVEALFPSLFEDRVRIVDKAVDLREKGLAKLRKEGWIVAFIACVLFSGCFRSTTYYVPEGGSVMLRKPIRNARVWVLVDGERKATKFTIPAGWMCQDLINE